MGRPKKDRTGERILLKNGKTAVIIAYRNSRDMDIILENGAVLGHLSYRQVQRWARRRINKSKKPQHDHSGESIVLKDGVVATIIAYRSNNDIDVQFSNGILRHHLRYVHFKNREISWHQSPTERVGEKRIMGNGQTATIIEYRNCRDIDVQFEDGSVCRNVRYDHFTKCTLMPEK